MKGWFIPKFKHIRGDNIIYMVYQHVPEDDLGAYLELITLTDDFFSSFFFHHTSPLNSWVQSSGSCDTRSSSNRAVTDDIERHVAV